MPDYVHKLRQYINHYENLAFMSTHAQRHTGITQHGTINTESVRASGVAHAFVDKTWFVYYEFNDRDI